MREEIMQHDLDIFWFTASASNSTALPQYSTKIDKKKCKKKFLSGWALCFSHYHLKRLKINILKKRILIIALFWPFLCACILWSTQKYCWLNSPFHLRCYGIFALARILVPPGESLIYTLGHQKSMPIANPIHVPLLPPPSSKRWKTRFQRSN